MSHVPFLPERGADGALRLHGHVARANPHWQALEAAARSLAIFQGPARLHIPDLVRRTTRSVPTWNYAVVHAHGRRAGWCDEAELQRPGDRLSRTYEAGRPAPWRMDEPPRATTWTSMLRAIVGFEIAVERLEGKFKLSQNRRPPTWRA